MRARRKMVIVVVTAGWLVVCLDHNLKVLWEKSVHGHFPHHAAVREVRTRPRAVVARAFKQHPCHSWLHRCLGWQRCTT
jgi:hypothetical protein